MTDRDPRIAEHYDDLAPFWAEIAQSPSKSRQLWPALERMLPDLDGARVLDAGCGSGVTAARLTEDGADVVGVDLSEEMLERARERVPDARFVQGDLGEALGFLDDGEVDVVVCQHVFSHLPDLREPLSAFARVLGDDGVLVASTHNPVYDYVVVRDGEQPNHTAEQELDPTLHVADDAPTYRETEQYDVHWNPDGEIQRASYYRRPFEALLSPLLDAGFDLDAVAEPDPPAELDCEADEGVEAGDEVAGEHDRPYPAKSLCLRATR